MSRYDAPTGARARPRLTVHLDAVAANYKTFAAATPAAQAAAVVKADGYGLGAYAVARRLQREGCDTFFVANAEEGVALAPELAATRPARIFVFAGVMPGEEHMFLQRGLAPVLNTLEQVELWAAARAGAPAAGAALHVDTGINRLGLTLEDAKALAQKPDLLEAAHVDVLMSHLACAATPQHAMNAQQLKAFEAAAGTLGPLLPNVRLSLANSAGALLGPDYAFDMTRIGIGLYGGNPLDEGGPELAAAATLEAPIIQVRRIRPGEHAGYGAEYSAAGERTLATAALGYGDGVLRAAWGEGYGVINGVQAPIAGRVSMDLITFDVTDAGNVEPGAMIEYFGANADINEQARACDTVAYELLTRIGPRCARRTLGLGA